MLTYDDQCKEIQIRNRRIDRTRFDLPRLANRMLFIYISYFVFLAFVLLFSWVGHANAYAKSVQKVTGGA